MAADSDNNSGSGTKRSRRGQKLKSALRANLKKRKDLARKLTGPKNDTETPEFSVKLRQRNIATPEAEDE